MLAGRMKLNTFLLLAGASVGAAVAGVGTWLALRPEPPVAQIAPATQMAVPQAPSPGAPPATPLVEAGDRVAPPALAPAPTGASAPAGARDIDTMVLSYVGKDIGSDKLKDVTKGKPWKLNVYQDAGKPTANRAKVDLNRNDKWDEKFTFADGTVTREVAPADDENYTLKYRWDGGAWVEGG